MNTKPSRYAQLDGLRAIAVGLVLLSHWGVSLFDLRFGRWGVLIFFVLSGFLITGILLDERDKAPTGFVLRRFYVRRFLRIFPIFYLTVAVTSYLFEDVRQICLWHFTYTSNFYFFWHGASGYSAHFWSLAVEEQFYVIWPLLMLCIPGRYMLHCLMITILIPVFYYLVLLIGPLAEAKEPVRLLFANTDALGIGALLAYGIRTNWSTRQMALWLLALSIILAVFTKTPLCINIFQEVTHHMAISCCCGFVVLSCVCGIGGPIGAFLRSSPVTYIGKISYGIYILHMFAQPITEKVLLGHYGAPYSWLRMICNNHVLRHVWYAGFTVGLASLSWFCLESPINKLKRFFPYSMSTSEKVTMNQGAMSTCPDSPSHLPN
jgi:peptidoglycan/LPS O-acetylase OafA/YrhL